jgi:secreted PhoX family phosphatase
MGAGARLGRRVAGQLRRRHHPLGHRPVGRGELVRLRHRVRNRPEDAEIDPFDNSLYTALTNNTDDPHGRIRRLAEEGRDPTADSFAWSDVAVGGPDPDQVRGFSSPDNLVFDRFGNLWMVTDISSSALNEGVYAYHRNNGIFMIRVDGPDAGLAFRFGSVPNEAESTGPIWTPDQTTMFLAIQHRAAGRQAGA